MTPEIYEGQLKILQEMGFYTPTEEELLGWIDRKHGLPERSVIIRMDIGIPRKDYEDGFRLLEEYGFKAILFILTNPTPEKASENKVGWDTIEEWVNKGVLIPGSHGTRHPYYTEISAEEALGDALNSKEIIEEKLGRPVYFFAYPYDAEVHEELLLEHFKMLFGNFSWGGAQADNPGLVGTLYPYSRGGPFDWEKFRSSLLKVIGEGEWPVADIPIVDHDVIMIDDRANGEKEREIK